MKYKVRLPIQDFIVAVQHLVWVTVRDGVNVYKYITNWRADEA